MGFPFPLSLSLFPLFSFSLLCGFLVVLKHYHMILKNSQGLSPC